MRCGGSSAGAPGGRKRGVGGGGGCLGGSGIVGA